MSRRNWKSAARFINFHRCITLDDGYGNTGSCKSAITFIDGEKGILRYRGIPIEELAEKSTFVETAYLLIYGHLPTNPELRRFSDLLTENEMLHEDMKFHFEGFPPNAHPMAILSSMINAASCFYPELSAPRLRRHFELQCRAPHFEGAHHRGVRLSQVARAADHLSQARLQIHGELPAHDVLRAVPGLRLETGSRSRRWI